MKKNDIEKLAREFHSIGRRFDFSFSYLKRWFELSQWEKKYYLDLAKIALERS